MMDERENDEKNVMGCRGEHGMRGGSRSAPASHSCLSPGKPCDPQGGCRCWLPFRKGMSLLSQLREIKKKKKTQEPLIRGVGLHGKGTIIRQIT